MTSRITQQQNARDRYRDTLYAGGVLPDYEAVKARIAEESEHCPYCEALVHPDNWTAHMTANHVEEWDGTLPGRVTVAQVIGGLPVGANAEIPSHEADGTTEYSPVDSDAASTGKTAQIAAQSETAAVEQLTVAERVQLSECEAVIDAGIDAFMKVGIALGTIRDGRLYRETHQTFEAYVAERWQINSRQSAAHKILSAQIAGTLSKHFDVSGLKQSHALALAGLPADELETVYRVVKDTAPGGKITTEHIRSVVAKLKGVSDGGFHTRWAVIGGLLAEGKITLDHAKELDAAVNALKPKLRGHAIQYIATHGAMNASLVPKVADVMSRPASYLYTEVRTGYINGQLVGKANLTDWQAIVEEARLEHIADSTEATRQKNIAQGKPVRVAPIPVTIFPGDKDKTLVALRAGLAPHYPGDTDWLAWLAGILMEV